MTENNNDWGAWSHHVLIELKRLNTNQESMDKDISEKLTSMKIEISQLQVKAGIWGAIGGAIPVIVVLLFKLLN